MMLNMNDFLELVESTNRDIANLESAAVKLDKEVAESKQGKYEEIVAFFNEACDMLIKCNVKHLGYTIPMHMQLDNGQWVSIRFYKPTADTVDIAIHAYNEKDCYDDNNNSFLRWVTLEPTYKEACRGGYYEEQRIFSKTIIDKMLANWYTYANAIEENLQTAIAMALADRVKEAKAKLENSIDKYNEEFDY